MVTKFFKCSHCGNVVVKLVDSKVPVVCCGKPMEELAPNTVEASGEKHIPAVTHINTKTLRVKIGSEPHPMLAEHHIVFIYVETARGGIFVNLDKEPEAEIYIGDEDPIAVYEYCNLHGLWVTKM